MNSVPFLPYWNWYTFHSQGAISQECPDGIYKLWEQKSFLGFLNPYKVITFISHLYF